MNNSADIPRLEEFVRLCREGTMEEAVRYHKAHIKQLLAEVESRNLQVKNHLEEKE